MEKFALDSASTRTVDQDGRMRIGVNNISKATVSPYYGREIPKAQELGLDPDKIYFLLRDPEEMAKAAPTFNHLPILSRHVPVTADRPRKDLIVGTTGSEASYDEPYLKNSLMLWDSEAIKGVENESKRELSSAYHYRADMTPGTYQGTKYDGVMRDIRGNHVAVVDKGRAGPDVIAGDHLPQGLHIMKHTRTALAVRTALMGFTHGKLAQNAKPLNFDALVKGVKHATIAKDIPRVVKAVMAMDIDITPEELTEVIEASTEGVTDDAPAANDDDTPPPAEDDTDDLDALLAKIKAAVGDEKYAAVRKALGMGDDTPAEPKEAPAMDKASVDAAIAKARTDTLAEMRGIREAEAIVRPIVGELVAMDSADAVYRHALTHLKVDHEGVSGVGLRRLVEVARTAAPTVAPVVAMDAAASKSYAEKFGTTRLVRS